MSFFADPWLFNCRNDQEQKAIVQAISSAARYAEQRGVVLVAAAGNEGIDLNHPILDEISPDFPPGAATTRPVNNNCVVLPTEIPGVVVVTATGAENLLAW
jgi:lantibiotic leader peptide-processing serine protease